MFIFFCGSTKIHCCFAYSRKLRLVFLGSRFLVCDVTMASSCGSDFSSASLDYISQHAQARDVESNRQLLNLTLFNHKDGFDGLRRENPKLTIESAPLRFVRRQHHSTKGVRDFRLYGWVYVRRHDNAAVLYAIHDSQAASAGGGFGGKMKANKGKGKKGKMSSWGSWRHQEPVQSFPNFGPLQRATLESKLKQEPIYHFVIRGTGEDTVFAPPNDRKMSDMVTCYFESHP